MESNTNLHVDKLITFGQMALEQGWYDQAREYFEQALALDASNREAMKGLARVNEILSRKAALEPVKPEVPVAKPPQPAKPRPEPVKRQRAGNERGGKKRWLALAVVIPVLLLVLSVAYQRVQVAQRKATPVAEATPTSQLALLDLGPDLIHPEELGLFGGQIRRTCPYHYPLIGVPDGENHFSQRLTNRGGEFKGWVSIFLFESTDKLDQAFAIVNQNTMKYHVETEAIVGEKAVAYEREPDFGRSFTGDAGFAFTKCHALAVVFVEEADVGAVVRYSQSLAERLAPLVCR